MPLLLPTTPQPLTVENNSSQTRADDIELLWVLCCLPILWSTYFISIWQYDELDLHRRNVFSKLPRSIVSPYGVLRQARPAFGIIDASPNPSFGQQTTSKSLSCCKEVRNPPETIHRSQAAHALVAQDALPQRMCEKLKNAVISMARQRL